MSRPNFSPVLIQQSESNGTYTVHGEAKKGLRTYSVPIWLFHKVPAYCIQARSKDPKKFKHLSIEKVFALYHGLRKRAKVAEDTGRHQEKCSQPHRRSHFYFSAEQAYMEQYGGKHYQVHRQVLVDLGAIKAIPAHEEPMGSGHWTRQEVCILPNNSGLIQFQCPPTNYGKKEYGFAPNCPDLDPLFWSKYTYLKSVCIDPSYHDFLSNMKRKYPDKIDSVDDHETLISSLIAGDISFSISENNGRHHHLVTALKRELRYYLRDKGGHGFLSLDIKATIGRMLYVLLNAFATDLTAPLASGSGPSLNQKPFTGYNSEDGKVDRAGLYSSLKLTPVYSEASKKLRENLGAENRDKLIQELPRFLETIEAGFYEAGIEWVKRTFPDLPAPNREDIKEAVMPFVYGIALDSYPEPTAMTVAKYGYGFPFGAAFEKEFPAIGQAIRALKTGPNEASHCDMSRYIFRMESYLVQTLMAKDIFDLVEGVLIVQDCVYFIPKFRNRVWSVMTAYMMALGFQKEALSDGNHEPPTDWISKKKRDQWETIVLPDGKKTRRKKTRGIHPKRMKRFQAAWDTASPPSQALR